MNCGRTVTVSPSRPSPRRCRFFLAARRCLADAARQASHAAPGAGGRSIDSQSAKGLSELPSSSGRSSRGWPRTPLRLAAWRWITSSAGPMSEGFGGPQESHGTDPGALPASPLPLPAADGRGLALLDPGHAHASAAGVLQVGGPRTPCALQPGGGVGDAQAPAAATERRCSRSSRSRRSLPCPMSTTAVGDPRPGDSGDAVLHGDPAHGACEREAR